MKTRKGWQRRVLIRRYGTVENKTIARIWVSLQEAVYDGGTETLSDDWALEVGDGEFVLYEDLGALLEGVEPKALSRAVSNQAARFAEMVARHMDIGRVLSVGAFVAQVVAKHAPDFKIRDPAVSSRGQLTFQVLTVPPINSSNSTQWRILRVAVFSKKLTKPLVEEVLSFDAKG